MSLSIDTISRAERSVLPGGEPYNRKLINQFLQLDYCTELPADRWNDDLLRSLLNLLPESHKDQEACPRGCLGK